MKALVLAVTLAAVVGCGSGQMTQADAEAAAVTAQLAILEHEQALAEHADLIRKRDDVDAIQRDLIENLTKLAGNSTQGQDSDFVRRVHADIAEEREIQQQYADEFAVKIKAAEQRVAEAKAALEVAK